MVLGSLMDKIKEATEKEQDQISKDNDFKIKSYKDIKVRYFFKGHVIWFVAKDIAECLSIRDTSPFIYQINLEDRMYGKAKIKSGVIRKAVFISLRGLMKFLSKSRRGPSKDFHYWIVNEFFSDKKDTDLIPPNEDQSQKDNEKPLNQLLDEAHDIFIQIQNKLSIYENEKKSEKIPEKDFVISTRLEYNNLDIAEILNIPLDNLLEFLKIKGFIFDESEIPTPTRKIEPKYSFFEHEMKWTVSGKDYILRQFSKYGKMFK